MKFFQKSLKAKTVKADALVIFGCIGKKIKLTGFSIAKRPMMTPNITIDVFAAPLRRDIINPRKINKNENERLSVSIIK